MASLPSPQIARTAVTLSVALDIIGVSDWGHDTTSRGAEGQILSYFPHISAALSRLSRRLSRVRASSDGVGFTERTRSVPEGIPRQSVGTRLKHF
jgi:hypothetical protein